MLIDRIKTAFKTAIRSGKFYSLASKKPTRDYNQFNAAEILSNNTWDYFVSKELRFRKRLSSKKVNYGDFRCKGDIKLWIKLIKIFISMFYKNNVCLLTEQNHERWSISLLKYVFRILKTIPNDPDTIIGESLADNIKQHLEFINKTLLPYFSTRNTTNAENTDKVHKDKLIDLWINKRKKAIQIIKNNGQLPVNQNANIFIVENENYYNNLNKYANETNFDQRVEIKYFQTEQSENVDIIHSFTTAEIEKVIYSTPNGKSPGQDGVLYEDIKSSWNNIKDDIKEIFLYIITMKRFPDTWKSAIIRRIPKKTFTPTDLSTLRDISLLPTLYKIFSVCLCERISPYIQTEIAFWQRAYLKKRDRQELIFNLITEIDDFKHISTKFYLGFIDFADAFGSLDHKFIFKTLESFDIPHVYCVLIENLYRYSCFNVICGNGLSGRYYIVKGTKTGDPLSGFLFLMVIDRMFKPMVNKVLISKNIENEGLLNPLPVQGFADDIALVTYSEKLFVDMVSAAEPIINESGLEVKITKCALFYERRSGNNWYHSKNDKIPDIKIQNKTLPVLKRKENYVYLGKSLQVDGEDQTQIIEMIETYKELVLKISTCELPLSLKVCALNNMALAKVQHHFYNTRIEENVLESTDTFLTKIIRDLFMLYDSTTRTVIYLPRLKGGIGVKLFSMVYRCSKVAFAIKMLNHSVEAFRRIARNSLDLDMKKRGVKKTDSNVNFLGYEISDKSYIKSSNRYGSISNWITLNRHARKLNIEIKWKEEIAVVYVNQEKYFDENNLQQKLYDHVIDEMCTYTDTLRLQGSFLNMRVIENKISNCIYYNWKVDDRLTIFCLKARLNILPTNFTKHIWNRENVARCPFCNNVTESIAHLLNGCQPTFKNFYSRRHDRIVDKLFEEFKNIDQNYEMHNNKCVDTIFPEFRIDILQLTHRKPDLFYLCKEKRTCTIIEVTICYDLYFTYAFNEKTDRYTPLKRLLETKGYKVDLKVMCFGSLGCIKSETNTYVKQTVKDKNTSKSILKWCSISNIIMANYIWRHRVKKLFRA